MNGSPLPLSDEPGDWLTDMGSREPASAALIWGEQLISYSQLCSITHSRIREVSSTPGSTTARLVNSRDKVKACLELWTLWRARQAALPIRPDSPLRPELAAGLFADSPATESTTHLIPDLPANTRLLLATSGSSGKPKLVVHGAPGLRAAVDASLRRIPVSNEDVWLHCLPLEHIGGLSILLRCARAGAACLLLPNHDPQRIAAALRQHPVSHVSLTPSMLQALLDSHPEAPPSCMRHVLIGGAALHAELEERARDRGWPLCVSYGMSETASQVATRCEAGAVGSVGRLLAGFEVCIEADSGEILVRGPALMSGYLGEAGKLEPATRRGWFHTGDLGRLDAQGRLFVTGRADDLLNNAGLRLHPQEVEARLSGIPGVGQMLLSARPDPIRGDLLVAAYTGSAAPEEVLAHCRALLPGGHRPRECIRLERLPTLESGKPDRRGLRRLLREGDWR